MSSDDFELQKKIKELKLNEKTDTNINILLLGETGVGKSTFINSIANYLTYTDLKTAEKEDLLFLIPSKYEVSDRHGMQHTIQIGSENDKNEYLDTGMSATQDVKTYVFPIWGGKTKIRLIDTPGMGDTRGLEQDDINCENILSYIGQLHELHAICFLFKPTNTRLTIFFRYCISQILSRLDKSASKNIIFIFTNTRGTDYSPGETLSSLKEIVKDIKASPPHVDIPLNKNIFCFDNEAVKYLAALKTGIDIDNAVKLKNRESWEKSAGQCWELIKYIVGDVKKPPLKPHFIKSTSAINEARRLITQLSQPLAEIAQLINDNLYVLQRHKDHLNLDKNSLEELKKKLYMPVINLEITTLTQPVTVCANSKCAEVYKVGDTNKWHYKQRCHDPCYLTNVCKEMIGAPELVHCAAMNSSKMCNKCGCDFSTHMHIYYMSKTKEDQIVDPNVQKNIGNKEKVLENANQLINNMFERKMELEKEHDIIVKSCARFAHFLQNNAITPFNDAYKGYIQYLIDREKTLGVKCNITVIHHLQKLMREYEEAKKSFDEALKIQKKLGESVYVTPQKIQESIQELYRLKHNGKKIKELYECQKKSRSKEHEFSEYVHKVIFKQDKDEKKEFKKKDKKENEAQKKPDYKNKHYNKDAKTENQQRSSRSKSQQRGRPRTPPPSYQDANRQDPPSRSYHPPPAPRPYHPPPAGSYHPPPPGPYHPPPPGPYYPASPGSYHPPPYNYEGYPRSAPYPPPPGPAPAHHDPYFDSRDRGKDEGTTYAIKVVVDKSEQSHHTAREYSPREAYPPRESFPSYPPYGEHYHGYPYPHSSHGPPPSGRYPQYSSPYRYDDPVASGQSSGARTHRGDYQERRSNTVNDRGRGDYRGGRGANKSDKGENRGGKGQGVKTQKFKPGNRKKRNEGKVKTDSDDSDTSVASSKK